VSSASSAPTVAVRHLQLVRAALAAIAALMITFSSDHSAPLGVGVFSGFAIVTGIVFFMSAWVVYPKGRRWPALTLGTLSVIAGMVGGFPAIRTTTMFFALVIPWALATGVVEAIAGWRERAAAPAGSSRRSEARDALTVGVITIVFGVALMFVPGQYLLRYYIAEAHQSFTLTGITIAVGIFGGYAAIVAVYLGIAGFSPRRPEIPASDAAGAPVSGVPDPSPADPSPAGPPSVDPHPGGAR